MRGGSIGGEPKPAALAGLASAAMAAPLAAAAPHAVPDDKPRRPRPKGKRRTVRAGYGYYDRLPAGINRHTGQPHEHAREIARRKRQAERIAANREARADRHCPQGFGRSRRGLPVPLA